MRRIAVLGCGGAGKTTLANALGTALGLPVIHSDFYRPGWEQAHPELVARWIVAFRRRHRPRILGLLAAHRGDREIFVLRSRRAAKAYLRRVTARAEASGAVLLGA